MDQERRAGSGEGRERATHKKQGVTSIHNVKEIHQIEARKAKDPIYSTEQNQIEMHPNLQPSLELLPESQLGRAGRTLETQTSGSSHFTHRKTEAWGNDLPKFTGCQWQRWA